MAVYSIEPTRENLHGAFAPDLPPILTVEPGDTVVFHTLDAGWNLDGPVEPGENRPKVAPRGGERDNGHALCGPVAIRGARPGSAISIRIDEIRTGGYGWTVAGGWKSAINERIMLKGEEFKLNWKLDPDRGIATSRCGFTVPMRPFMGVMGLPWDSPGWRPSWRPTFCGGNLDCKELVAGSTLFLPVACEGGLFSVGDGHAVQGDGEVSSTAIECPMERVALTFDVMDTMKLQMPRAHTPAGWITFGFDENLDHAALQALEEMLALMQERHNLTKRESLAMASLVVDLRITQLVNGAKGVHAILPHNAFRRG